MYPLALGLIIDNNGLWAEMNALLRESPIRVVADLHHVRDLDRTLSRLAERGPDILFAEIPDGSGDPEIIAKLKQLNAAPMIVALHPAPTVEMVVAAHRAGADEFLHAPIDGNLQDLLNRAQASFGARHRGTAVAFVSVKGGCGASTIACHSAVSVGARAAVAGKRALLIDLDFNTGVSRFIMKARSEYSVVDAVKNFQKLDLSFWNSLVSPTHTGLDVLSAPENLRSDQQLNRDEVQHVLSFARGNYHRTILDLGRGLGQLACSVLPEICELYVVATNEITPLHMAKQVFRTLDHEEYPRERVRFILNRVGWNGRATTKEIEKVLGFPVFISLPNDYAALHECYSYGRLLPPRSKLAAGIESLVTEMMGEAAEPKGNIMRRLLGRPPNARHATERAPQAPSSPEPAPPSNPAAEAPRNPLSISPRQTRIDGLSDRLDRLKSRA